MSETNIASPQFQLSSFLTLGFDNRRLVMALLVVVLATNTKSVWSQNSKNSSASMQKEQFITTDGWQIAAAYYKSQMGKDGPVVVLLHKKGGNQLVWQNGLAERLNDKGYAVIAVDLRHHGRSKSPNAVSAASQPKRKSKRNKAPRPAVLQKVDYMNMYNKDMEAVKKFIFEEHQKQNLNMRKMAIVATEMSAVVALNYTWRDWSKKPFPDGPTPAAQTPRGLDVQALVLLSPASTVRGITTNSATTFLKSRPISLLVCVGTKDALDRKQGKVLFDRLGGQRKKNVGMYYQTFDNIKLRGTDLLEKGLKTEQYIIGFLDKHLEQLDAPWRDRQSKLKR